MGIKEKIKANEKLKKLVLRFLINPVKCRPQWWIRLFQRTYMKRGSQSVIYRSVRKDIVPFNQFIIGRKSVIEDYSVVNNGMGDVVIGDESRVGLHNTIIGPVTIGSHVIMAQGVVVSGLNHTYTDPKMLIERQQVTTQVIEIEDDVWVGANVVITAGVHIGKHSVIGAGSVVTGDIPSYSVALGTPARVVKRYNFETKKWLRC